MDRKESNLSHEGDCWVYGNALVSGNARVSGNAIVSEGEYTDIVINLILPQFSITVLSTKKMQIGCRIKTIEEWKNTTLEEAVKMGLKEENYELFMYMIKGF